MPEADREQVPWGSCEKNFENIVIRTWIRRRYMDIVCGAAEIVTVELTCAAPSLLLPVPFYESCIQWCISPGVPRNAICCRHVLVYCGQAHPWQTCMYVFSVLQLFIKRMCVLPVLKHGPRNLMYVQVRRRDRTMRNICNWITRNESCRRICLNKFEREHMH